ncbi:transketolase [Thermorudis peleae]|uniref:transketolase n=1 Tax=Thermorudis peleae TaxID=1382356 RepID=UPI00068E4F9D|nr:transketolase [Thermorudis peleae]MBX6752731.1 transketolase [Thermorudis peleae]
MGQQTLLLNAQEIDRLTTLARELRREVLIMTTEAGSGHPTSSMSAVEIMVALYFGGILRYDPHRPDWPDRDRFILSKGHAAPILYAVLAEAGYFPKEQLKTLRKLGSPLEGHPNMRRLPGVEASTGSLGQGLSIGIGHALAGQLDGRDYQVYVLLGDGEIEEGQVWEAALAAGRRRLGNLVAIVDHNRFQQTSPVTAVADPQRYADQWRAFGWKVVEVNGHDLLAVHETLRFARDYHDGPVAVIAYTVKGKGVPFLEKDFTWHGRAVPKDRLQEALEALQ